MAHRHAALAVLVVALSTSGADIRAGIVLARERPVPESGPAGIIEIEIDPAAYHRLAPPSGSFFLVVPHTTVSEGSYGQTSAGVERPPAAVACKPQDFESCGVDR